MRHSIALLAISAMLSLPTAALAGDVKRKVSDFDGQTVLSVKRSQAGCEGSFTCGQIATEWQSNNPEVALMTVWSPLNSLLNIQVNIDGETYDFGLSQSLTNDEAVRIGNSRVDFGGSNTFVVPVGLLYKLRDGERIRLRVSGVEGHQTYKTRDPDKKATKYIRRLPELIEAIEAEQGG